MKFDFLDVSKRFHWLKWQLSKRSDLFIVVLGKYNTSYNNNFINCYSSFVIQIEELNSIIDGLDKRVNEFERKHSNEGIFSELQALNAKLYDNELSLQDIKSRTSIASTSNSTDGISSKDADIMSLQERVIRLENEHAQQDVNLADMNLKLEFIERASYNGTYIWKIESFTLRQRLAQTGKMVSLYSSPFYTSRFGFKMCLKIYLDGDGMGKGSHSSLFLVIMKGDYDDIISWPFKQKVIFKLIGPAGERHVTGSFHPSGIVSFKNRLPKWMLLQVVRCLFHTRKYWITLLMIPYLFQLPWIRKDWNNEAMIYYLFIKKYCI